MRIEIYCATTNSTNISDTANFAVCLQIDLQIYEWGLSSGSGDP